MAGMRAPIASRRVRRAALLAACIAALAPAPGALALADALERAKDDGAIGEQADGTLGVRTAVSAEVRALVEEVNAARRAEYARVAETRGTEVANVAAVFGAKLIERETSGRWVRGADGAWVRKP